MLDVKELSRTAPNWREASLCNSFSYKKLQREVPPGPRPPNRARDAAPSQERQWLQPYIGFLIRKLKPDRKNRKIGRGGQNGTLEGFYTLTTDAWRAISSGGTIGPRPLPGQTRHVWSQASGVRRFDAQNGQVRHWRGRAS